MFGWFKKKSESVVDTHAVAEAAISATQKYGAILEDNPGVLVFDNKVLPLPKTQMKTALRIAWTVADSNEFRASIECCYLGLSNFQDGVGDKPIMLADSSAIEAMDISALTKSTQQMAYWSTKITSEMHELRREFDGFTKGNAPTK